MNLFKLNLFAFDGEGGETADGAASVDNTENAEDTQNAAEDKAKAFEELIKGEYKDEYDKRIKETLNRRFKAQKDSETELGRYTKLADLLSQKYGTADPDELFSTIDADDAFYEDRAYEEGLTVEQYRKMQQLSNENERYRQEREKKAEEEEVEEIYQDWLNQSEEMLEDFPGFDLEAECENERFVNLLQNGFTVRDAYTATHMQDIITAMMAKAASEAKQETVDNISSRSKRPLENGAKLTPGKETHFDPENLSKEQINELIARAKRGERISF